ncbi:hypothetical protein ACWGQT_19215 [Streptomyces yangpuensis]
MITDGGGPVTEDARTPGSLPVAELRALKERLVALDVTAGARWAAAGALEAVRTAGRGGPVRDAGERAALAELLQVAAWIAFDAEQQPLSRWLHLRALQLAAGERESGPSEVEPLILAVLSMQEEHLGRPASSLRIAGSVLARADLPGRVAAIFHVRAGRALARLGQGPRAERALRTAGELLAEGPSDRDPAWAWWFDRAELDGHAGLARAALGDPEGAAGLLHGAAYAGGDGPAYRVLFAAELARVLARGGDWHAAEAVMSGLVGAVPGIGSVRALRVMVDAVRLVGQGHRVPRPVRATARDLGHVLRGVGGVRDR